MWFPNDLVNGSDLNGTNREEVYRKLPGVFSRECTDGRALARRGDRRPSIGCRNRLMSSIDEMCFEGFHDHCPDHGERIRLLLGNWL